MLPAGRVIAQATALGVDEVILTAESRADFRSVATGNMPTIPEHLQGLWEGAVKTCKTQKQQNQLRHLLANYADVFSTTDHDVGCTSEITHSIRTQPGAQPIKQRARRLGPEKEKEVEKQAQE